MHRQLHPDLSSTVYYTADSRDYCQISSNTKPCEIYKLYSVYQGRIASIFLINGEFWLVINASAELNMGWVTWVHPRVGRGLHASMDWIGLDWVTGLSANYCIALFMS